MFAAKENIIPHFETISSVDQGTDVNWKVRAIESIVKKATAEDAFQVTEEEARILRGAQVNLGLDSEDFYFVYCIDLNQVELSSYGREQLIDYLADLTKENFWFALREIESQKKKSKGKRRAR